MQTPASPDLYLETDGVRLRYREAGAGRAVILVHGWTLDLDFWDAQADALVGAFRVVRFDRRGFGLSSGSPSIAADTQDLWSLCEHLALDSAALVGMSQGARVVLQFARSFPGRSSCLVVDGPPWLGPADAGSTAEIPYDHYRALARRDGVAAFRREWQAHGLVRLRTADPQAHALLARMLERYPGRDLMDAPPSAAAAALGAELPADKPVLIISGELDLESRRQAARALAAQLPRAERVDIPGAGHLCALDNPSAYNRVLRQFLESHAPRHPPPRSFQ